MLAERSVDSYVPFVRKFLADRFGDGSVRLSRLCAGDVVRFVRRQAPRLHLKRAKLLTTALRSFLDRKSTRLNSSHEWISYAVFCLKKKKYRDNHRDPFLAKHQTIIANTVAIFHDGPDIHVHENRGPFPPLS